jgi:hypothetical protein
MCIHLRECGDDDSAIVRDKLDLYVCASGGKFGDTYASPRGLRLGHHLLVHLETVIRAPTYRPAFCDAMQGRGRAFPRYGVTWNDRR